MMKLMVKGHEHILLDKTDVCPICGKPRNQMCFSWLVFHGSAESSCCGAVYQIKDFHIDNPDEDEKKLLELLAGDYIEFSIDSEWIEPLKQAISELGIKDINNEEVYELAKSRVEQASKEM